MIPSTLGVIVLTYCAQYCEHCGLVAPAAALTVAGVAVWNVDGLVLLRPVTDSTSALSELGMTRFASLVTTVVVFPAAFVTE